MVVTKDGVLRAFLVNEDDATFETGKPVHQGTVRSYRNCELDTHSSECKHYQLRHHNCKLCDVTCGMIMHAGIYEICSIHETCKRNHGSPSKRRTIFVQRGLNLGVECCHKVTGDVYW